jgi:hypothetical protein
MCHRTSCRNCGKPSWAGCGMHVTSALAGVKEEDRCPNWKTGRPCSSTAASNASSSGDNKNKGGGGGIMGWFGL